MWQLGGERGTTYPPYVSTAVVPQVLSLSTQMDICPQGLVTGSAIVGSGIGDGVKSVGHGAVLVTVTVVRVTMALGRPAALAVVMSAMTVGIQEDSIFPRC